MMLQSPQDILKQLFDSEVIKDAEVFETRGLQVKKVQSAADHSLDKILIFSPKKLSIEVSYTISVSLYLKFINN